MLKKFSLFAALLLVSACGTDDGPDDGLGGSGGSGGTGGTAGAGGSGGVGGVGGTGAGGTGGTIEEPPDGDDTGWTPQTPSTLDDGLAEVARPAACTDEYAFISTVRGWVTAPGGRPLGDVRVQLCIYPAFEPYICLRPTMTGEDGVYTVEVAEKYRCIEEMASRMYAPSGQRATPYCLVHRPEGSVVKKTEPSVLQILPPAVDLPPLGDPEAARPVTFEDGLVIEWTPSMVRGGGAYEDLRGRRIPTDAVGLCDEARAFDGLYALSPDGRTIAPGFPLSLPNEHDYAPGTKVELFVLGSLDCRINNTTVREGTWGKFGEATVSADGARVESDEGVGLPCMSWLAYRSRE